VLCSFFTALTGGSGVTILALGGLLLPLLTKAGFPEKRGIGLVTSASALGVLLAPSVPLIMYAIIARVPINSMFLAGILPALVMVAFLLLVGGFLRRKGLIAPSAPLVRAEPDRSKPPPGPPNGKSGAGGGHRLDGQRPGDAHRKRRVDRRLCAGDADPRPSRTRLARPAAHWSAAPRSSAASC
jgi:hypothetical protein